MHGATSDFTAYGLEKSLLVPEGGHLVLVPDARGGGNLEGGHLVLLHRQRNMSNFIALLGEVAIRVLILCMAALQCCSTTPA